VIVLQAHLPPEGNVPRVIDTIDEECRRIATDGLAPQELARTQARMATHLLRDTDAVLGRGLQMAVLEQQRGAPELVNDLPRLIASVTEEQIVAAAARLTADRRASIEAVPGGAK
jgi:zinc protease